MNVKQQISMDMVIPGIRKAIYAVQGDSNTRTLEIELRCSGMPWVVPDDVDLLIRYQKPDGTSGVYDTMPDGSKAWSSKNNILTIALAPQMLTVSGDVAMEITFLRGLQQISTFRMKLCVTGLFPEGNYSDDYTNIAAWLEKNGKVGPNKTTGFLEWDRYVPEGKQEIEHEVPDYTNLFVDGSYVLGEYLSGTDLVKPNVNAIHIKKIPVKSGDVIRIKATFDLYTQGSANGDVRFRVANNTSGKANTVHNGAATWSNYATKESDNVVAFKVQEMGVSGVTHAEFSFPKTDYQQLIITKNEEIKTRTEIEVIEVEAHYEGLRLKPEVGISGRIGGVNCAEGAGAVWIKDSGFGGTNNKTDFLRVNVPHSAKAGDKVTIHFDYRALNIVAEAGKEPTWQIEGAGDINGWGLSRYPHNGFLPVNQSGHWSYTTSLTKEAAENNYWATDIRCDNIASGYLEISNYKLELGTVETDFTPSPMDTERRFLALEEAGIDGGALPDYAEAEYKSTLRTLQGLVGDNTFSFGFISDLHFSSVDSNYSPNQLRPPVINAVKALNRLSRQYPMTCIAFGGDYQQNGTSAGGYNNKQHGLDVIADVNAFASCLGAPTMVLPGNHEWVFDGQDLSVGLTDPQIYRLLTSRYPYIHPRIREASRKVFYMLDDANEVCMMFLAVSNYQVELSDETRAGIDLLAAANTGKYPVVVCTHHAIYGGAVMPATKATIDYMVGKGLTVLCWISGHAHADWQFDYNGVPVITNEGCGLWASRENQDGTTYTRTLGTVSENAFTVITINKDTRKIHCTRFGAGSDREYSY